MMQITIEPVARLVEQFARLPGIGPKTAQRRGPG
jgi:recombinational DNA repair protein RecR